MTAYCVNSPGTCRDNNYLCGMCPQPDLALAEMIADRGAVVWHDGEPEGLESAKDMQIGGGHYKDMAIQPIDYICGNKLGWCEGNVVKYITRWRTKNGLEDLRKAGHYIDLLIERVEAGKDGTAA